MCIFANKTGKETRKTKDKQSEDKNMKKKVLCMHDAAAGR
jgi:hypothetical protein